MVITILLLTSTYAWFTSNKNISVNTLDVKVATSDSLEISADAYNWSTQITGDTLLEVTNTTTGKYRDAINQIPATAILPMSTVGNVNDGKMDMFLGTVNENYKLTATKETEKHGKDVGGNFIAFDIFLKASRETKIQLDPATSILPAEGSNQGIENATRIAILNYGTPTDLYNSEGAQDLKEVVGDGKALIIEPNCDTHTGTGKANAQNIYGITGLNDSGNDPLTYYGIKEPISSPGIDLKRSDESDPREAVNTLALNKNFSSAPDLITLNKGITKLRIYLWIEGDDVDCEDAASGANLKFNLQFTTADIVPGV